MEIIEPDRESFVHNLDDPTGIGINYWLDDIVCLSDYSRRTGRLIVGGRPDDDRAFLIELYPDFDLSIKQLQDWFDQYIDEHYPSGGKKLDRISFSESPAQEEQSLLSITTPDEQYLIDATMLSPDEVPTEVTKELNRRLKYG